jgi:hypothetical protein
LTLKERKRANNALVETTNPGFKISGNTTHKIPDKNRNYVQTGNTTEVPYKFVNSGTHCDIKKGAQASKQCTGRDNLPRIQIPGNTMHKTPNKKQELRTDGQHKCQNHRKKWFNSGTHESGIKRSRLQHKLGAPKNHRIKNLISPTLHTLNKFISTSIKVRTTHSR